jgi:hypothetical protein
MSMHKPLTTGLVLPALAAASLFCSCASEQKTNPGSGADGLGQDGGADTGAPKSASTDAAGDQGLVVEAAADGTAGNQGSGEEASVAGDGAGHTAREAGSPLTLVKQRLNSEFIQDIIAGPYWYPGPSYQQKLAFRAPRPTPFDISGDSDCYSIFVYDFNQDGWQDILSLQMLSGSQAVWYENPKGAGGYWTEHVVFSPVSDESPSFTDMDGDGKPELVTVSNGYGGWAEPDWANPSAAWTFHAITSNGGWGSFTHGLGTSDVNGDGRPDFILSEGWWEQPAVPSTIPWLQHPAAFWAQEDPSESYGGAQMFAYDVDADGDNDIVTSLQAHGWGVAWFENIGTGFVKHMIVDNQSNIAQYGVAFSQPHALALADLDGDGVKDVITGKRKGAHGYGLAASELNAPAVLYWFRLIRQPGQAPYFEPHLLDSEAGVGTQLIVADVNGDGLLDVLTAARAGAFVFWGK